ncbi:MAG: Holliday junction resolvase RuvX [Firmicutes bacterium]|nr:Holliday junction resolvase RuvX [Bacillota bacterium]
MNVVAVDPGREKCGIAVVADGEALKQQVVERRCYLQVLERIFENYRIEKIVIGDGTGSAEFVTEIGSAFPAYSISVVDEYRSTEEARLRYWQEHRPRGWRRVLPTSMQVPPEPYDDYVALILAERFQKTNKL